MQPSNNLKMKRNLYELSYPGNIGIMELVKFYSTAPKDVSANVKSLISTGNHEKAWKIIQRITKTRLHPSATGAT